MWPRKNTIQSEKFWTSPINNDYDRKIKESGNNI